MANTSNAIFIDSPMPLAYYKGNIVAVHHYNHKTLRYNLFKVEEKNYLPKSKSLRVVPDSYDAEYEVNKMVKLAGKVKLAIVELSKNKTPEDTITKKEIDDWLVRYDKDSKRKTAIKQKTATKKLSFIEEFENWIKAYKEKKQREAILSGNLTKDVRNVVKDFISALNLLKDFQYDEYDDKPFFFNDINNGFLEKLILYAYQSRGDEDDSDGDESHKYHTKGNLANKTLNKRFESIFQFINEYYKRLPNDVEKKPRLQILDKTIIRLDREELRQLENLEITDARNTHYDYYRDCLLFLCYTGLRFGDFRKLNKTYYHEDSNLIILDTEKTRKRCEIYLFDKAKEIAERYNFDFKPSFTTTLYNQTLNRGIKEMLKAFDLFPEEITIEYMSSERRTIVKKKRDLITCHTGRRTYISVMLENGMDVYDLISTTGHTNLAVLKHYIDLFGRKRIEKFRAINEQLK